DGAHVNDGLDLATMPIQPAEQRLRSNEVHELVSGQVAPALVAAQPVTDDDFGPALAQRRHEVGTNESSTAGYDEHGSLLLLPSTAARLCGKSLEQPGRFEQIADHVIRRSGPVVTRTAGR